MQQELGCTHYITAKEPSHKDIYMYNIQVDKTYIEFILPLNWS